jgi:uncharacterized membrane protein YbhN (UPF0104 family)
VSKKLRFAVSGALLAWIAWGTDWPRLLTAFTHLRVELWLGAVALLTGMQALSAWRWQMLARPLGFERTVPQLLAYYFIGMYFNLLLPTSVGGDVVRAWYLTGRSGRRLAALAAVFLDRFSGLVVLLALACAGVLLSPQELPAEVVACVWGTAACAALTVAAVPVATRWGGNASRRLARVRLALAQLAAPRLLAGSTLLSLGVQAGNVALVMLIGTALGAPVPLAYYWILVPMVTLLTMLPVSINGMGVREQAMVLFLAPFAVADETAVALGLLWFSVFFVASLAGGLVYTFGQFERPPAPAAGADEREVDHGPVGGSADQGRASQHSAAA